MGSVAENQKLQTDQLLPNLTKRTESSRRKYRKFMPMPLVLESAAQTSEPP